ncbi:MAG: Spx/MgsR family RNA polymerase-binding regulatory protein [Polyangiaceae bacterium]
MTTKASNRTKTTVLAYAGCDTCRKALRWLADHGVDASVRPIVDEPPTVAELEAWIPRSGKPVTKWLNTSGQSYRAIGKEAVQAATPKELVRWLAKDGKLVKRPVLVHGDVVLVGFDEAAYEATFPKTR